MRCKNCGWENPDGSIRCAKCNAPLSGSMVDNAGAQGSAAPDYGHPLKGTLNESSAFPDGIPHGFDPVPDSGAGAPPRASRTCPKCGYPVRADMKVCPSCGSSLSEGGDGPRGGQCQHQGTKCPKCGHTAGPGEKFCSSCGAPLRMGTVNNWIRPEQGVFCTLKPVPWANEGIDHQPVSYSGDSIVLNRGNTDPNNNTITSKEQAILIHEGNDWYIENRSELETTFIKVGRKTKLYPGDVIVLGNRLFEFNA